jgi:hypothetical protein
MPPAVLCICEVYAWSIEIGRVEVREATKRLIAVKLNSRLNKYECICNGFYF